MNGLRVRLLSDTNRKGVKLLNLELLIRNIKRLCDQRGITLTQLEKDLGFSAGALQKWRTSEPSIGKVLQLCNYFGVSLDSICGLQHTARNAAYMAALIRKTEAGLIIWRACPVFELPQLSAYLAPGDTVWPDILKAWSPNDPSGMRIYFVHKQWADGEQLRLFMGLSGKDCILQNEDPVQLQALWDCIQEERKKFQKEIDSYKNAIAQED